MLACQVSSVGFLLVDFKTGERTMSVVMSVDSYIETGGGMSREALKLGLCR